MSLQAVIANLRLCLTDLPDAELSAANEWLTAIQGRHAFGDAATALRTITNGLGQVERARVHRLIDQVVAELATGRTVTDNDYHQVVKHLPDGLQDLAFIIGVNATLVVSREFGGARMYVPKVASERLIQLLGLDAATALSQSELAGTTIEVPRGTAWHARIRWLEIKRLRAAGFSQDRIALIMGVTGRWVREVCAMKDIDDTRAQEQPSLPF